MLLIRYILALFDVSSRYSLLLDETRAGLGLSDEARHITLRVLLPRSDVGMTSSTFLKSSDFADCFALHVIVPNDLFNPLLDLLGVLLTCCHIRKSRVGISGSYSNMA